MTTLENLVNNLSQTCPAPSTQKMDSVENTLGCTFSKSLKTVFHISDGICTRDGNFHLVWPLSKILKINLELRTNDDFKSLYMTFESCLFFSSLENGDMFFMPVRPDGSSNSSVFVWNHETDERTLVSFTLQDYIKMHADARLSLRQND